MTSRLNTRLGILAAIAILVLAPAVLLGACLFGSSVFVPFDVAQFPPASIAMEQSEFEELASQRNNYDVTETPLLVVPELALAHAEFEEGRFPGWNPYARFGAPLYANGLAGITYPPNAWLLLDDDPSQGLALAAYLSYLIAGLLMFAFLRESKLRVESALFGALAFMFCATIANNAHFYMRMNALIWLPGMLHACLRMSRATGSDRIPAAIGLALCLAMTWLAGFPPFAIASTAFVALYATLVVLREMRFESFRFGAGVAVWIGGAAAVGLAASAVQLAPLLSYFPESSRNLDPSPNWIAKFGFDPMGFLGFFFPTIFGEADGSLPQYANSALALALNSRAHWVDDAAGPAGQLFHPTNYNFTEYSLFVGTLPILLAVLGMFGGITRLRFRMAGLAFTFALLATAPWWLGFLYELPGALKTPMRWIGPVCVAVVALSAVGFEALWFGRAERVAKILAIVAVVFGVTCLVLSTADWDLGAHVAERYAHAGVTLDEANRVGSAERIVANLWRAGLSFAGAGAWLWIWNFTRARSRAWFEVMALVAILATTVELLAYAKGSNVPRTVPTSHDTDVQQFLREQRDARAAEGGITFMRAAKVPRAQLDLPSGLMFPERVRDLNAYAFSDPWSHRLFLAAYGEGQMARDVWPLAFPDDARLNLPLFDVLGARYVLSTESIENAGPRVGPTLKSARGEFHVYERPNPLPRAFVVQDLRELPDDDAIVEAMVAEDFDPRTVVLVTPEARAALPDPTGNTVTPRSVRFRHDRPDDVLIEVEPGEVGYLVVCDAAMRGWTASVNGEATDIVRGNLFMRVLPIGSRGADVRFHYTPPGLGAGLVGTGAALLAMLLATISYIGSRRTRQRVESPL